jgi:Flp pilus assembly pilin Flp
MRMRNNTGQSILEYTLVLGAVIAVVVYVLLGSGGIKEKVQSAYTKTGNTVSATSTDASIGVFSGVSDTATGSGGQ